MTRRTELSKKVVSPMTLTLLLVGMLIFSLFRTSSFEFQKAYASPYTNIDVAIAYDMITSGSFPDLVVLDVRTKSEYEGGHIYGAVWIPYDEIDARISELAGHENHEIIVYCKAGGRSAIASANLEDNHDFTKVYNMLGGMDAWQSAPYPVHIATVHNLDATFNYDTIQAAIDAPQTLDGHTILVDAGTYYENLVVWKSVFLVGENPINTIIDGNELDDVINVTADNVLISDFLITNSSNYGSGIYFYTSSNNTVTGNIISGNSIGMSLDQSSNNSISGNSISHNGQGLYTPYGGCANNTITRNNFTNNTGGAVELLWIGTDYNIVSENNIMANGGGIATLWSVGDIISGNNIVNNGGNGITLTASERCIISNNTIYHNNNGISFGSEDHCGCFCNSITENNITANNRGIYLWSSNGNNISANSITDNGDGICIDSYYIMGFYSSGNTIAGNNITANNQYGMRLINSPNNFIYHNNFLNNAGQVYLEYPDAENSWDDGCPSGGNYWSDYDGVDLDHDGIGDSPHVIDEDNQDNYPLVGLFHTFNTSLGSHVNVVSNSTIEDFEYFESSSTIKIHISNMTATQTFGFCRLCIPKDLISPPYKVIIDDGTTEVLHFNDDIYDNGTHRWIYFAYTHSTHEVNIITSCDFELHLSAGWNMVSFPCLPEDASFTDIFSGVGFYQVLTWDGTSYVTLTTAEAGWGYWVLVLTDCTVTVADGIPVASYERDLSAGWSMIGSILPCTVDADCVFPSFYQLLTWDGTSYVTSALITPGKGYWALALQPTHIIVDESCCAPF